MIEMKYYNTKKDRALWKLIYGDHCLIMTENGICDECYYGKPNKETKGPSAICNHPDSAKMEFQKTCTEYCWTAKNETKL